MIPAVAAVFMNSLRRSICFIAVTDLLNIADILILKHSFRSSAFSNFDYCVVDPLYYCNVLPKDDFEHRQEWPQVLSLNHAYKGVVLIQAVDNGAEACHVLEIVDGVLGDFFSGDEQRDAGGVTVTISAATLPIVWLMLIISVSE